jgi:plastocyanin
VVRALGLVDVLRRGSVRAAVAVAVLLVAGCGGASSSAHRAGPVTSAPTPSAAGVVLKLTGNEYSFAPSALKASAGLTTIRFTNGGAVDHDFSIDALKIHLVEKPGRTGEATLTLKPGTYTFFCAVPGHRQSGMQGTLTVS